ncbi:MAG: alkaline phosphatase family protein [Acidobacteria bacterium]|nr:alkaline phosphatase family protein [Acidobacteriota bacterium]
MKRATILILLLVITAWQSLPGRSAGRGRPLLVISVDGLDYRYLRDANQLGLRIPNLRRLMREGEVTAGVTGVYPTVTWSSHTSLITGATPIEHGILSNRRPRGEGGDYYWDVSLLRRRTLWEKANAAGLRTAAITWPVTVDARIDFNLPEYFRKRRGGAMDLPSIESKATPGLVEKISRVFPSFAQEWMDDRTRTLATVYLLRYEKPDLILLHLVDHDAEAHETGPFSRESGAILEYTDELIGEMLRARPREMVVAIVSDHGFERADRVINLPAAMKRDGLTGPLNVSPGLATTSDAQIAEWLRESSRQRRYGVGREIPIEELKRHLPRPAGVLAAFEPLVHHLFGAAPDGAIESKPVEKGVHGLWPERADYASTLILHGPGIRRGVKPSASMLTISPRLEEILLGGPSQSGK